MLSFVQSAAANSITSVTATFAVLQHINSVPLALSTSGPVPTVAVAVLTAPFLHTGITAERAVPSHVGSVGGAVTLPGPALTVLILILTPRYPSHSAHRVLVALVTGGLAVQVHVVGV